MIKILLQENGKVGQMLKIQFDWINLFSLGSYKIMCKLYLNAVENIIEVSLNIWELKVIEKGDL